MDPFRPFHSQSERERPWKVVLTFEFVDEIMCSDRSNETFSAVLSRATIYLVCCSNFWVYGSNPMVLPFKWKLYSSTFTWYYSVADADLHIGGGGGHPDPEMAGGAASKNFFFRPLGPHFGGPWASWAPRLDLPLLLTFQKLFLQKDTWKLCWFLL